MTEAQVVFASIFSPTSKEVGDFKSAPKPVKLSDGRIVYEVPFQQCIFCRKVRTASQWYNWRSKEVCPVCDRLAYGKRFYAPAQPWRGGRRMSTI